MTTDVRTETDLTTDLTKLAIDPSWGSWTGLHGGYVASRWLATAAATTPPGHRPIAASVSFLAPLSGGEPEVRTRPVRTGASSSVVTGELGDLDAPALTGVLTAATTGSGPTSLHVAVPDVPAPGEVPTVELPTEMVPFVQHIEYRPVGALPFSGAATAELGAWMRLRDGRPVDAAALMILADGLPPALYATVPAPLVVPSVDLQVVFSGEQPAGGWVFGQIRTRNAWSGWCVDDSDVWSEDGRLLAQARQTRRVLDGAP